MEPSKILLQILHSVTITDIFIDELVSTDKTDIGKLKELSVKKQKFKATISMADKHPLSLRDQVLPIVKLLVSNGHETE